jgi:uncharacterized membrane protein (UPF0127 family)
MITTRFPTAAAALIVTLAVACGPSPSCPKPPRTVSFDPRGTTKLHVEVADTPASRARGLMGRRRLPEDRGMLFVFSEPSTAAFWMKDTSIPLSVAFFDEHRRIIDVLAMRPCRRGPCRRYRASVPYVGAIEANRGYFVRNGIGPGDRVYPRIALACR